jgi:hypothetical protein
MRFQTNIRQVGALTLSIVLVLMTAGCKLSHSSTKEDRKTVGQSQRTAAAASSANPSWDLNCVYERLQNPPDSFHYSYKHNDVAWEADVTPTTIDGTRTAPEGVRPIHGVRSDTESWHGAWMNLSAISGMSSTFALIRNAESNVREGTESVNGFDTIRYSVDTTRSGSVEAGLYRATLGPGGFEKGTVWVTAQGCPVKFALDAEMRLNDGRAEHDHYQEAIIRK